MQGIFSFNHAIVGALNRIVATSALAPRVELVIFMQNSAPEGGAVFVYGNGELPNGN
eukprot:SAG31_NODE_37972_length_300_cov_0.706468_1_plen_56_part_10